MTKEQLLKAVDEMNDFTATKDRVKEFIINGHELKDGRVIRTYDDYVKNIYLFSHSHSNKRVSSLVRMAKSKDHVTSKYKELSMIYAICFFYPLEVVDAIHKLKVEP